MKILNKNEFKELLESNPTKQFAFYEYKPDIFIGTIFVTVGNQSEPTFGATSICSNISTGDDSIIFTFDWDLIADYDDNDQFAVLDDNEVSGIIDMLSEALQS